MNIPASHLAQEAIAALVDGELSGVAAGRAARHLTGCLQCRLAVEAQREAKEALHTSRDVAVPGDLLSRLQAIPFTADVSSSGGFGGSTPLLAGPDRVVGGAFSAPLTPQEDPDRPGQARWLRRGMAAGLAGIGVGVVALAVTLPTGATAAPVARPGSSVDAVPVERTEVVPPVVRTVTVGTDLRGGTP
ncbi:zf-HC2 domain-containing protein [Klenkia sp. LSe6-5]|uniref:Zf-HC2 domain-containing protein n=1 Tax=Klenkia sesuvii TaxID=3103137 RepID=A0ABU8DP37_9ACTN